jgi:hypothetical protein
MTDAAVSVESPQFEIDGKPSSSKLYRFVIHSTVGECAEIAHRCNVHGELVDAIKAVRALISEAAQTGFNCHEGDWTTRLFESQGLTHQLIAKAEG